MLCFGLLTASQVFTRVFAGVSAWAHSCGIRLLRYLDDWLILASSEIRARQYVRELLSLCHSLGIVINEEKSDLMPSQSVEYLGMTIDTVAAQAFPTLAVGGEVSFNSGTVLDAVRPSRPALAGVVGAHVIAGETGTSRETSDALAAVASEVSVVPQDGFSTPPGTLVPGGQRGPLLVDGEGPSLQRNVVQDTCSGPSPVFGRISVGVGSSPPRLDCVRGVVGSGEFTAHQSPGIDGSVFGPAVIPEDSRRPSSDSDVQQLDGSSLCQQASGDGLRLPLLVDRATSPMDGVPQCPSGSEVTARTVQCPSGPPQPAESGAGVRVVSPPTGGEETHPHLGVPVAGRVRDTPQCETAPLLLSSPGSQGHLRGCLPSPLERPQRVLVSSLSPGRESCGPGQRDPKSLDDSSRPSLAGEGVVRRPPPPPPPPDPTTSGSPLWDRLLRQPHFNRFHGGVHALNLHAW